MNNASVEFYSSSEKNSRRGAGVVGVIYLIHFNRKFHHARHYMGWTSNLSERIQAHKNGDGSRLMRVINEAGIKWQLVRIWVGDRNLERKLKRRKEGPYLCPKCRKVPFPEYPWYPGTRSAGKQAGDREDMCGIRPT